MRVAEYHGLDSAGGIVHAGSRAEGPFQIVEVHLIALRGKPQLVGHHLAGGQLHGGEEGIVGGLLQYDFVAGARQ